MLNLACLALLAAVATYLLLRRVPSLRSNLEESLPDIDLAVAGRGEVPDFGAWLLWLRWTAILVVAGVIVVATTGPLYVARAAIQPLWAGLVALFAFNAVLSFSSAKRVGTPRALTVQITVDLLLLAWMLHHAGGVANPFASFFVFNAVIASIVLPPRRAERMVLGLVSGLMLLTVLEASGVLQPLCIQATRGICVQPDALHLLAAGFGAAALSYGCSRFVLALVASLSVERERLRQSNVAVREEREKLSLIIEQMADVVIFADTTGQIRLHNRAALSLWPSAAPTPEQLRVCHTQAAWQRLLERITNPKPHEEHPLLVVGQHSFEPTYAPVRADGGQLAGVVMIARDVTQRLEHESLRMRQERLAVVGRLAASLAHELNNPLSAISLFTQHAMKQGGADNPLYEHLQTVRRNADLCTKIVRDLLTYARQRAPSRSATDVAALVSDAARTLSYAATRAQVRVDVTLEGEDVMVSCDRDQMLQVIVNLGLNGIEAMEPDGRLTLHVCATHPNDVTISVQDTGSGVPDDLRDAIWGAFYTTKNEGTGLGLAVVRELVAAHGGNITLHTELGTGSTFTLTLPRKAEEIASMASLETGASV